MEEEEILSGLVAKEMEGRAGEGEAASAGLRSGGGDAALRIIGCWLRGRKGAMGSYSEVASSFGEGGRTAISRTAASRTMHGSWRAVRPHGRQGEVTAGEAVTVTFKSLAVRAAGSLPAAFPV